MDRMEYFKLTEEQRRSMNMIYEMTKKRREIVEKIDQ